MTKKLLSVFAFLLLTNYSVFPAQGRQFVKVQQDRLYVANKYDASSDLIIRFRNSMFNRLMTFDCVGIAHNLSNEVDKNIDRSLDYDLNYAYSDNIGPVCLSGEWIGGNHSWQNDGKTITAETVNYLFLADGKILHEGDELYSDNVEVHVENNVYYQSNDTLKKNISPILMYKEYANYKVLNGSVFVHIAHKYFEDAIGKTIDTYYGMQSMFKNEDMIKTIGGVYNKYTAVDSVKAFGSKENDFFAFIEKNTKNQSYQSSVLLNDGIGNHENLPEGGDVFFRGSGKSYHKLISGLEVTPDLEYEWRGVYSWNRPYSTDDNYELFVMEDYNSIYILLDFNDSYNGTIEFPDLNLESEYQIIHANGDISITNISDGRAYVSTSGGGYFIKFERAIDTPSNFYNINIKSSNKHIIYDLQGRRLYGNKKPQIIIDGNKKVLKR